MSVTNSVATPGFKDGDLKNKAPKDKEAAQGVKAVEGKVPEPVATEVAAVGLQQQGAEQVQTIYHTTLTTRRTQNRAHKYPIGSGREKSELSAADLNAIFTGTDATDFV